MYPLPPTASWLEPCCSADRCATADMEKAICFWMSLFSLAQHNHIKTAGRHLQLQLHLQLSQVELLSTNN